MWKRQEWLRPRGRLECGRWSQARREEPEVPNGQLGFRAAQGEVFPQPEELRYWNHRIMKVIDQLPKKLCAKAWELLTEIAYAELSADRQALAPNASADGISSSGYAARSV
jgi:hypothetical protein